MPNTSNFRSWLLARPRRLRDREVEEKARPAFFLTGPELIERLVRAIQLNQSVILTGPRGCGKTYCIGQAIEKAGERGIIPRYASVFVQGNREIPRDYLAEDEITFRMQGDQVFPTKKAAPLFRFARRDPVHNEPLPEEGNPKRVQCEVNGEDCNRFVLFLDEINRFSDGVLDSLLSVLEEKKAVLGGREYFLPVVVCMTMNPPGYDSSARKLSPPLAARIGRSYRLSTPDIDTMSDLIVPKRWRESEKQYTAAREQLLERISNARGQERADLEARHQAAFLSKFPEQNPQLIRKAALVTLCLWGEVGTQEGKQKPGMEYLTDESQELLREVARRDRHVATAMKQVSEICHYGPDGRAVADWLVAATAVALQDSSRRGERGHARLLSKHLVSTVVESVGHKIYDNFSPATRPDLTAKKEHAVLTVTRQILFRKGFDDLVDRIVDDGGRLWRDIGEQLVQPGVQPSRGAQGTNASTIRNAFVDARVTDDEEVALWIRALREGAADKPLEAALQEGARNGETGAPEAIGVAPILISGDDKGGVADDDIEQPGFSSGRHEKLARLLVELPSARSRSPVAEALAEICRTVGPVRYPLRVELANFPVVKRMGVDSFLEACRFLAEPAEGRRNGHRRVFLLIARELEELTHRDFEATHSPADIAAEFLKGCGLEPTPETAAGLARLVVIAAEDVLLSGDRLSEENSEFLENVAAALQLRH
jgi:MoxR-like ATPase